MDKFLRFASWLGSLMMALFYLLYVTNNVFCYIPFDSVFVTLLDNIIYFGPIVVCGLMSVAVLWSRGKVLRWIALGLWIVVLVFSFVPGDILGIL